METDQLARLQRWYASNCDGEWEYQQGVRIETLTNPGWAVVIDLAGTALEGRAFEKISSRRADEHDWLACHLEGDRFLGYGGPGNLSEVFGVFLDWAEAVAGEETCSPAAPSIDFAPGQMWSIHASSAATAAARVVIGRVEPWDDRVAVHVSVMDLAVPEGRPGANGIAHMPFDHAALAASVGRLLAADAAVAPAFEEGYAAWKANEGGIFTLGAAQAIDALLDAVNGDREPRRDA